MHLKTKIKNKLVPLSEYKSSTDEDVIVSVCVGTYNQKEYICQCIDSILSQLVNFRVEIIVNDDASTDGTQDLLLNYQKKHPDIMRVFLSKENQFQKTKQYSIVYRVHAKRIKGKYVSLCDGDDYFCDNLTLYSKVEKLEKNKECIACYSRVKKIDSKNGQLIHKMPKRNITTGIISSKKLIDMFVRSYCFQTSSYFFRANLYIDFCKNYPIFAQKINVFDEPVVMFFASIGDVYYINKIFSTYRKFSNNSWSNNNIHNSADTKIDNLTKRIDYLTEFNVFTDGKYKKSCDWGIKHAKISILRLQGKIGDIFSSKELISFYKKRYPLDYIRIKLSQCKGNSKHKQ